MESCPTAEVSNVSTAGELIINSATRVPSPTLAMRRPNDESRPEISVGLFVLTREGAEVLSVFRTLLTRQEISLFVEKV